MLICTIEIQDGERQYTAWDNLDSYTYEDYESGKITDRMLLSDFFHVELEDSDRDCPDQEQYWIHGEMIVYIGKVSSITEEHLEIVRRYV